MKTIKVWKILTLLTVSMFIGCTWPRQHIPSDPPPPTKERPEPVKDSIGTESGTGATEK